MTERKFPNTEAGTRAMCNAGILYGAATTTGGNYIENIEKLAERIIELEETSEGHKQAYEGMRAEWESVLPYVDMDAMRAGEVKKESKLEKEDE